MTVGSKIRVLVVEDHPIVRDGLVLYLQRDPEFDIAGAVGTGADAVEAFRRQRPDVVLMDLQLPVMSGVDAIRAIRREDGDARIVVLTMYEGDEDIRRALDAGAATYLLKASLSDHLIDAIRKVHQGDRPLSPEIAARLKNHEGTPSLTNRDAAADPMLEFFDFNSPPFVTPPSLPAATIDQTQLNACPSS